MAELVKLNAERAMLWLFARPSMCEPAERTAP
jgi:hypothetical protein